MMQWAGTTKKWWGSLSWTPKRHCQFLLGNQRGQMKKILSLLLPLPSPTTSPTCQEWKGKGKGKCCSDVGTDWQGGYLSGHLPYLETVQEMILFVLNLGSETGFFQEGFQSKTKLVCPSLAGIRKFNDRVPEPLANLNMRVCARKRASSTWQARIFAWWDAFSPVDHK